MKRGNISGATRVLTSGAARLAPLLVLMAFLGGAVAARSSRWLTGIDAIELDIPCSLKTASDQMPNNAVIGMVVPLALPAADYAKIPRDWLALDGQEIRVKDYPDLAALMIGNDPKHRNDKALHLPDYSGLSLQIPKAAESEALTAQQLHLIQLSKARPTPTAMGEDRTVRWYVRAKS